jgi:uncharacterized phage protein (TIGR01671 family)
VSRFSFRAWDVRQKKMLTVIEMKWIDNAPMPVAMTDGETTWYTDHPYESDSILMQSTGLVDAKGVEVFEGDIIKPTGYAIGCFADRIAVVCYGIGTFDSGVYKYPGWYAESADGANVDHSGETLADAEAFKVIGNIHANPELVK